MLRRLAAVVLLSTGLSGCFEVDSQAAFNDKGEVLVNVELAVSADLMALAGAAGQGGAPLARMSEECGKAVRQDRLPPGVRTVKSTAGQRKGMFTCSLTIDIADPIGAFEGQKGRMQVKDFTIERLAGTDGYRIRASVVPQALAGPAGGAMPSGGMGNALLMAMFADRYVTIALTAHRIEKANGEMEADGTRAVWKFPVAALLDTSATKPLTIEADVIYNEGWFSRWKRWLFG